MSYGILIVRISPSCEYGVRVSRKESKKPNTCDKSRGRPDHPRCRTDIRICMCSQITSYTYLYIPIVIKNQFRGFEATEGRTLVIHSFPLFSPGRKSRMAT